MPFSFQRAVNYMKVAYMPSWTLGPTRSTSSWCSLSQTCKAPQSPGICYIVTVRPVDNKAYNVYVWFKPSNKPIIVFHLSFPIYAHQTGRIL